MADNLTERNKDIFFQELKVGDVFTYTDLTFIPKEIKQLAAEKGFEVEYCKPGSDEYNAYGSNTMKVVGLNMEHDNTQKDITYLLDVLKQISQWPGNLPDEQYTTRTGPNDAALRGGMVVAMRSIALSAINKFEPNYKPFN
jgi:hypothetical protein